MDREVGGLVADRALIGQASRAEQVADVLRARVSAGCFPPGDRRPEDEITRALGVSRNTLREAFRLLTRERLLVHELNRGTFVRVPDAADVVDLYRVRRHVECSVALDRIAETVAAGRRAPADGDDVVLGTADIAFHRELVAPAGSRRLDELRLVLPVMDNPRRFHEPYLARNAELLAALAAGDAPGAAALLAAYLADAERQLVEAYRT